MHTPKTTFFICLSLRSVIFETRLRKKITNASNDLRVTLTFDIKKVPCIVKPQKLICYPNHYIISRFRYKVTENRKCREEPTYLKIKLTKTIQDLNFYNSSNNFGRDPP